MKYSKAQLLGCIIQWSYQYLIIENGNDVQIERIDTKEKFNSYSVEKINEQLKHGCTFITGPNLIYEIY